MSVLSIFNTMTEVRPLSKALNPQLLPGCSSIGCPLLWLCVHYCVCVHLDGLNAEHKFRVWVTIFGNMSFQNSIQDFKSIPHNLVFMLNWCLL